MSKPLEPDDPAYWMLERGLREGSGDPSVKGWVSHPTIKKIGCYICEDAEFALMGLSLCTPCAFVEDDGTQCKAHIPADDVICDNGHDAYEIFMSTNESDEPPF